MSAVVEFSEEFEITDDSVQAWARLSGDFNRLHLDEEFAATTSFGRRIAHGPILASLVGERLAESVGTPWTNSSQIEFRFSAPVYVPSRISARVEIQRGSEARALVTCVRDDGTVVLTATASWQESSS